MAIAANAQVITSSSDGTPVTIPGEIIVKVAASDLAPDEFAARVLAPVADRYGIGAIGSWLNHDLLAAEPRGTMHKSSIAASTLQTLGRILVVHYSSDDAPDVVAAKIKALPGVEYAEPVFRRSLFYVPNDPFLSQLWYLDRIKAFDAWNISRADSTIIIAITDTGVDPGHPDLKKAIWRNPGEQGPDGRGRDRHNNGIDDDGNGVVDDWIGYDFGGTDGYSPDNDPTPHYYHGTHVAGIAAAVGDNNTGVVGVAFGAKIMVVKISDDDESGDPLITKGYDGILYAAKMGAKIINCSWGGPGYSMAEQEVLDRVTAMGSLIVAAAGNNGGNVTSYPASYSGVLSVASVVGNDVRSSFSNFNTNVGISAPGEGIFSTAPTQEGGSGYRNSSGTSMAAPVVSGAAALVSMHYPDLDPEQLAAVLRANSDRIDSINPNYQYLLGSGRINIEKALINGPNAIEVQVLDYRPIEDMPDGVLEPGETIELRVRVRNILRQVPDLKLELSTSVESIQIETPLDDMGLMVTGDERETRAGTFRLRIPTGIPLDYKLPLKVTLLDGSTEIATRRTELVVNPNYATTAHNHTSVTFTGNGRIGYNDFPSNEQGRGFRLDSSSNMLAEGGLMIGTGADHLADVVRSGDLYHQSQGLQTVEPYRLRFVPEENLQVGTAHFDDSHLSNLQRIGLDINLRTLQYADGGSDNQTLLLYTIKNTSGATLNNLHCALYLDWDIGPAGAFDKAGSDLEHRLGYAMNTRNTGLPAAGVMLVSDQPMNFNAFDNNAAPLVNGFYQVEKWDAMSGGVKRETSNVGDCSIVIGAGPITLAPGADTVVAFALMAGANVTALRASTDEAARKFAALGGTPGGPIVLPRELGLASPFPNPFVDHIDLSFSMPTEGFAIVDVYNSLGELVETLASGTYQRGTHDLRFTPQGTASAVYFVRLTAFNQTVAQKIVHVAK
jgi:serine protease